MEKRQNLEQDLLLFLKKDFDKNPVEQRKRFTEKQLVKAMKTDLLTFRKAIKKLFMKNEHIFQYVDNNIWKYRYRSKTRTQVYDVW